MHKYYETTCRTVAVLGIMISQICNLQHSTAKLASTEDGAATAKVTVIREDTVLDPQVDYGRLEIKASNITIDGRGSKLIGGDQPGNQRRGIAISSAGQSNVVLKNIAARGWETGLALTDASGWTVENCDFSDNFHDPDYGWGENGRRGGIVFNRVTDSAIRHCQANRVWDACVLVDSHRNQIIGNDFSHTSNTCLKLWHSSHNRVESNDLSFGIRIRPGEVHARDSTGVLIETGSNHNEFVRNDCRYGGDGIFVRVLNGWVSTDNTFIENDCSYANNNGFECWAPRNTFISNKANHCSYGFWLGGSDQTRLIDNEASFNGKPDGYHNSPHLPGKSHAGIVFMFGPSSHILAYGNRCEHNEGAGIALIGDLESKGDKWKAFHWVIAGNQLKENRWGIFIQHADWITLSANNYETNKLANIQVEENVARLSTRSHESIGATDGIRGSFLTKWYSGEIGRLSLNGPMSATAGEEVEFNLDTGQGYFSMFEWDLGGVAGRNDRTVRHVFEQPGFYRLGVTASGASGIDLAYRDFYVVSSKKEFASDPLKWSFVRETGLECDFQTDSENFLSGDQSTRVSVSPYHGGVVRLLYPKSKDAGLSLTEKVRLSFWIKANNPNMPGWQAKNPEVTFYGDDGKRLRIIPESDKMQEQTYNEAREGWRYFSVPLAKSPGWTYEGDPVSFLEYFTVGFDSWGGDPLEIWIDGVVFE